LRFWWLVLAGLAVALFALTLMLFRIERVWPPLFVSKAVHSYLATTELLVDSPTDPYLRTGIAKQNPVTLKPNRSASPSLTTEQATVAPTKALVDAANLFPLFVESDAVARIRMEHFGAIPGAVRAKALYAVQGTNRYRPSSLPVMQIAAVSGTPGNAIQLAERTAQAFNIWLTREQKRAHVPRAQQIIVRQLHVPREAVKQGGASFGLPALVALALFGAFLGLIAVADRMIPRKDEEAAGGMTLAEAQEVPQPSLSVASRSRPN
jgi:hypothetical protein